MDTFTLANDSDSSLFLISDHLTSYNAYILVDIQTFYIMFQFCK